LKQKPLRTPGESLSEERDRVLWDRLLTPFVLAAILVILAGAEWWMKLSGASPQPILYSALAAVAVGFCAFRFNRVRSHMRALKLGVDGEKTVGQFLEANRQSDWHIFHDLPGKGFNVDHVLVTPQGIFAIETKTFSKPAKGAATVRYDGESVLVNGLEPDRSPVVQARAARDWLRNLLLETTAIKYPVRGVVIFPGWFVEPFSGPRQPDVWVLNEKAFVKFVENEATVIKSEDVALARARLVNYVTR
jgi:Nuclease-related domain